MKDTKKIVRFILCGICMAGISVAFSGNAVGRPQPGMNVTAGNSDSPGKQMSLAGNDLLASYMGLLEKRFSPLLGQWAQNKAIGNISWFTIVVCAAILALVIVIERLLRWLVWKRTKAGLQDDEDTVSLIGHFMQALSLPFSVLFLTYGIYIALMPLFTDFALQDGANPVQAACGIAVRLISFITVIWFLVRLMSLVDIQIKRWTSKTDGTINVLLVPLVGKILRVVIVVLGGVILIQNMTGVKIGPLLASLGIGGIAVALAAKDSIANFFGTLTIIFDKSFKTGERILIDGNDGVVESVGFRSTRIRTLTGNLLTIPNEKITNSSIENIGQRPHIRWLTNIGITYDTPPEKVEQAVTIIKEILNNHEGMREDFPPRVYFNDFNDWSLNILVVAWYHPPNYWAYLDWLQKTCLEIKRRFADAGIEFAFPSRTIYMASNEESSNISKTSADQ